MHCLFTDIQADFEINWTVRYQNTAKINYFHRRADGQTSRTTTIRSFLKKKITKIEDRKVNINSLRPELRKISK